MRISLLCGLAAAPLLAGLAFAANLAEVKITFDGNERKGQYLYQKNCRESCHDGSGAKEMTPMHKSYAEWKALVQNLAKLPCAVKFQDKVSPADLNDIFSYLHGGAKDSPNPTK
jgi:hypothetical protein